MSSAVKSSVCAESDGWSQVRVDRLKALFGRGLSASQIAGAWGPSAATR